MAATHAGTLRSGAPAATSHAPAGGRTRRVFHLDVPSISNFGSFLLYEAVRQVFRGMVTDDGQACFDVCQTADLRDRLDGPMIDLVNATADVMVVGGGGLFGHRRDAASASGWAWNMPMELLDRLEVPLVLFAVGWNLFPGQEDFPPPFHSHIAATTHKASFFGLREHGSIERIASYLPPSLASRLTWQPCPTTLAARLYPDIAAQPRDESKRLAVQATIHPVQAEAGYQPDVVFPALLEALRHLSHEGWEIDSVPFHSRDLDFHRLLAAEGLITRYLTLRGGPAVATAGLAEFAEVPIMLGTRGHAQMLPFGMGAVPISLSMHAKIGFFAEDIGHPELVLDPRSDTLADDVYRAVNAAYERQGELRASFADTRTRFERLTETNLARIYRLADGGGALPGAELHPAGCTAARLAALDYSPRERSMSLQAATNAAAAATAARDADAAHEAEARRLAALERRLAGGELTDAELMAALHHRAGVSAAAGHPLNARALRQAMSAIGREN